MKNGGQRSCRRSHGRLASSRSRRALRPTIALAQEIGWEANGRDVQGTRYLPAREITRENVHRLEPAWTYRTGEADATLCD